MIARQDLRAFTDRGRFWPATKSLIANPGLCEAWLIVATDSALREPDAAEVIAAAIHGADVARKGSLPVFLLRPGSAAYGLPPEVAGVRTANLADPAWPETVRAAIEGRQPLRGGPTFDASAAYALGLHGRAIPGKPEGEASAASPVVGHAESQLALEIRPGLAEWPSFGVAVPAVEFAAMAPKLRHGIRSICPWDGDYQPRSWYTDGEWVVTLADQHANRRLSYFLVCATLPSTVRFWVPETALEYTVRLRPVRP